MRGFTLIEMSMVLIIIGLIVGGVLTGQHLLDSAKDRFTMKEITEYQGSIEQFYEQYQALPGDLVNANYFLPECNDDVTGGSDLGDNTCNGDGNNIIENFEALRVWEHLSLADYVKRPYTGLAYTEDQKLKLDINTPKSAIDFGGFGFVLNTTSEHALILGKIIAKSDANSFTPDLDNAPRGPLMDPESVRTYDQKLDDGLPNTGRLTIGPGLSNNSYATNTLCANADNSYPTNDFTPRCVLYWRVNPQR